jgi:hypothetical protein
MIDAAKDSARATAAARAIIDGRDVNANYGAILVTAEHTIATLLLVIMGDPEKAAKMLNEGILQGVEERLALYAARKTI